LSPLTLSQRTKTLLCGPAKGHDFHFSCITKWLGKHNSCPICREPVHKNRTAPALASHATNLRNAANFRYVAAAFPARQHFPRRLPALAQPLLADRARMMTSLARAVNGGGVPDQKPKSPNTQGGSSLIFRTVPRK